MMGKMKFAYLSHGTEIGKWTVVCTYNIGFRGNLSHLNEHRLKKREIPS